MNLTVKIGIVVVLLAVVGIVLALKVNPAPSGESPRNPPAPTPVTTQPRQAPVRLIDLGADRCIPCKMMAPILEQLRHEYAGRLQVDFYDVWKNPAYVTQYGVRTIPTQIFCNAEGKELWRHEGFLSKEDILNKWKELGVDLSGEESENQTHKQ